MLRKLRTGNGATSRPPSADSSSTTAATGTGCRR